MHKKHEKQKADYNEKGTQNKQKNKRIVQIITKCVFLLLYLGLQEEEHQIHKRNLILFILRLFQVQFSTKIQCRQKIQQQSFVPFFGGLFRLGIFALLIFLSNTSPRSAIYEKYSP